MTKIIFFDFDDTLYCHSLKDIPASSRLALKILHDKGIHTYICTGRSVFELDNFPIQELGLSGMITSNGQTAYDNQRNIIYENVFKGELKEKIVTMFNEKQIPMYLLSDKNIFLNYLTDYVADIQNALSSPIPPIKEYEGEKIYMASCFYNDEESHKKIHELEDYAEVTYWYDGGTDVVMKGSSKATGIQAVLDHHHLALEDSMAFGDGNNDVAMVQYCHIGIAMGNADKEVKEVADYITDDIDKDGLYKALKHFELI